MQVRGITPAERPSSSQSRTSSYLPPSRKKELRCHHHVDVSLNTTSSAQLNEHFTSHLTASGDCPRADKHTDV